MVGGRDQRGDERVGIECRDTRRGLRVRNDRKREDRKRGTQGRCCCAAVVVDMALMCPNEGARGLHGQ